MRSKPISAEEALKKLSKKGEKNKDKNGKQRASQLDEYGHITLDETCINRNDPINMREFEREQEARRANRFFLAITIPAVALFVIALVLFFIFLFTAPTPEATEGEEGMETATEQVAEEQGSAWTYQEPYITGSYQDKITDTVTRTLSSERKSNAKYLVYMLQSANGKGSMNIYGDMTYFVPTKSGEQSYIEQFPIAQRAVKGNVSRIVDQTDAELPVQLNIVHVPQHVIDELQPHTDIRDTVAGGMWLRYDNNWDGTVAGITTTGGQASDNAEQ